MPITKWCWRCRKDVAMLDEDEWQSLAPLLGSKMEAMKRLRRRGASLAEGQKDVFAHMALAIYTTLTESHETNVDVLRHHRASLYGPPCTACGKPLRTPRANLCAACGQALWI
jgi:uncharacterized OB-fold protein